MIKIQNMSNLLVAVDLVSVGAFKDMHKHEKVGGLDKFIASIATVERLEDGYSITMEDGHNLRVRSDGQFSKDNKEWTYSYQNNTSISRYDTDSIRVSVKRPRVVNFGGYNSSLYIEKVYGICEQWLSGVLPKTFKNWQVNVMDGSGNLVTCEKLGIKYNISVDNIEWCLQSENSWFGRKIEYIAKVTGGVYRFSCMDAYLKQLIQLKNRYKIKEYLDSNYTKIADYGEEH